MAHPISVFALLCGLTAASFGTAQATNSAAACSSISDAAQRLECYDRHFPPTADPQARAISEGQQQDEFGLSRIQVRERQPGGQQAVIERIQAQITRIVTRSNGQRVVSLDNGQDWLLTDVTSRGHLEAGNTVTIRNAALGTFALLTPSNIALRAKRLH